MLEKDELLNLLEQRDIPFFCEEHDSVVDMAESERTQATLTDDAWRSPMHTGNAPLSSLQLAVLLEGFNWQALNDAAQSAYARTP